MSLKPANIDHIIRFVEQITDTRIELQELQLSKRYEAPDLSIPSGPPTPEEQIKAKLEQLQDKLYSYLTPLWPEICKIRRCSQQGNQLRREVEALINYQYDRREVDQWISRFFSPQHRYRFGTDKGLIAYKEKLICEFQRVKKILEREQTPEPAERGQKKKRRGAGERDSHVEEAYKALGNSPTTKAQHLANWINNKYGDKFWKMKADNVMKSQPWKKHHPKKK